MSGLMHRAVELDIEVFGEINSSIRLSLWITD
jgi:hypothetical protein